jgi:tripartite-type tricarboxylate transporter receptor subunit TctC
VGVVQALHAATVGALETPSVQERFKELGASVVAPDRRSPEYLQRFVADEVEKWAVPIKASGASIN